MEKRKWLRGIGAAAGMLVLILDGKAALEGARNGIELCLITVIPALFPFIFLSILLSDSLLGEAIPPLRPVGRLLKMPSGSESLLLCAFLGGYPAGAVAVSEAYRTGSLSKSTAQRLLCFCSNAGPSFLFGMTLSLFPERRLAWILWGIHILSALMVGMLLPGTGEPKAVMRKKGGGRSDAVKKAASAMAAVCAWVILFRMLIGFLDRWLLWLLPSEARVMLIGLLELTNGCCALSGVREIPLRMVLFSGMLSFGGVCVTLQTASVTRGLSIRKYLLGKGLQFLFATVLCVGYAYRLWWIFPPVGAALYLCGRKSKKEVAIPG